MASNLQIGSKSAGADFLCCFLWLSWLPLKIAPKEILDAIKIENYNYLDTNHAFCFPETGCLQFFFWKYIISGAITFTCHLVF